MLYSSHLPGFSVLCFVLLLAQSLSSQVQNQHWQYQFGSATLNTTSSGILQPNEGGVEIYLGATNIDLSSFGQTLRKSQIPGAGLLQAAFYIDQREDLLFIGYNNTFHQELLFHIYNKEGTELIYELPIEFEQSNQAPMNQPVIIKYSASSYIIMDDTRIYRIAVQDDNHQVIYEAINNSERMTDACMKNDVVYACDVNGRIFLLDENGPAGQWVTLNGTVLLSIEPTPDGFLLTGQKDDKATLAKIDNEGQLIWQKELDGIRGWDVITTTDNGILVTGENPFQTGFVIKTNALGDVVWRSDVLDFTGVTIAENAYGAIYALGRNFETNGDSEVIKLSADGANGDDIGIYSSLPLNVNNIEAGVSSSGELFLDDYDANYFFPRGANTSTLFSSGLWLGGYDTSGELCVAAATYLGELDDYNMGPKNGDPSFFSRVWSVSRAEIDLVQNDISDGAQSEDWPLDIIQWPAKGNTLINENGEEYLINESLAPFVDANNDEVYNAHDGDYPLIKGEQMLWWIFNDGGEHYESGGPALDVEIIGNLYAISSCNEDLSIFNTSFLDFEITNKGNKSFPNVQAGLWTDPDLGCYTDDYIGSIPEMNAVFIYNEDGLDGDINGFCPSGVNSFEDVPPIQSIVSLNNDLTNIMYYYNGSMVGTPSGTIDPTDDMEYYNYLTGKWRDGTPLTFGGWGYDPFASGDITPYFYPDEPADPDGWSLCSFDSPLVNRRFIMSAAMTDFNPGDKIELNFALITTADSPMPCPNLDLVKVDIQEIQAAFNQGVTAYYLDLGADQNFTGDNVTFDAGAGAASYAWSTGSTNQSITVSQIGTYSVTIVDHYGCEQMDEVNILFLDNVDELEKKKPFRIFPNPTREHFTLEISEDVALDEVKIFSAAGGLMRTLKSEGIGRTFSTSGLSAGVYFVQMKIEGIEHVEKLMVF